MRQDQECPARNPSSARRPPCSAVSTPSTSAPPKKSRRIDSGVRTPCGHSTETPTPWSLAGDGQAFGKADRSVLGGAVGGRADLAQQAGRGHRVEKPARAALHHAGQHGARGIDMRHHVHVPARAQAASGAEAALSKSGSAAIMPALLQNRSIGPGFGSRTRRCMSASRHVAGDTRCRAPSLRSLARRLRSGRRRRRGWRLRWRTACAMPGLCRCRRR